MVYLQTNEALAPTVIITDLGSKFGTYMNNGIIEKVPIPMRDPSTLCPNDRFRLGIQNNEFRYAVAVSTLYYYMYTHYSYSISL